MTKPNRSKPTSAATLARLKSRLKYRGITHQAVADRAGVSKVHVTNVLNARFQSANVVRAAKALLAEAIALEKAADSESQGERFQRRTTLLAAVGA